MIQTDITVCNKLGLHARATAKLVSLAMSFRSNIKLGKGSRLVDAKNMMAVLMLGAGKGTVLSLHIDGEDEQEALSALTSLFARFFDEAE